jgi:hypothetical protein
MFWAINHGLIDKETYLPAAKKAWKGLLGCMTAKGNIGYSQPPGTSPSAATADNTAEYTDGAFLMAGNEFYKLVTGTATCPNALHASASIQASRGATKLCAVNADYRIAVPANAVGFTVYTMTGREIWEQKVGAEWRSRSVAAPEAVRGHGTLVVRYVYK